MNIVYFNFENFPSKNTFYPFLSASAKVSINFLYLSPSIATLSSIRRCPAFETAKRRPVRVERDYSASSPRNYLRGRPSWPPSLGQSNHESPSALESAELRDPRRASVVGKRERKFGRVSNTLPTGMRHGQADRNSSMTLARVKIMNGHIIASWQRDAPRHDTSLYRYDLR